MTETDLSIVVPAFNEQARLPAMLDEVVAYLRTRRLEFELLIVDDGSTDRTAALALEVGTRVPEIRVIQLPRNQGKGHAVRTGILQSKGRLVLFADADGSTPMSELERLEQAITKGADIAIGSRALSAEDVQLDVLWYRRTLGLLFRGFVSLVGTRGIGDTQCGFKLFRGPVAHALFTESRIDRFAFDVEVLMLAQREGLRIAEIPVNWAHQPGSRLNLATDSLRMMGDLVRIRGGFLLGKYPHPLAVD
jgi:dolichyl-phosphate beta-glucosyltransferase